MRTKRPNKEPLKRIYSQVPYDLDAFLSQKADEAGISKSFLIRVILANSARGFLKKINFVDKSEAD